MNIKRWIAIFTGFGGITKTLATNDFLFGYNDPFLANINNMNP